VVTDLFLATSAWSSDSLARAVPPSCGRGIDPARRQARDREIRAHLEAAMRLLARDDRMEVRHDGS